MVIFCRTKEMTDTAMFLAKRIEYKQRMQEIFFTRWAESKSQIEAIEKAEIYDLLEEHSNDMIYLAIDKLAIAAVNSAFLSDQWSFR